MKGVFKYSCDGGGTRHPNMITNSKNPAKFAGFHHKWI